MHQTQNQPPQNQPPQNQPPQNQPPQNQPPQNQQSYNLCHKERCIEREGQKYTSSDQETQRDFGMDCYSSYQVSNFSAAFLCLLLDKGTVSAEKIQVPQNFLEVPGRMQMLHYDNRTICIDFAHTADSLKKTLMALIEMLKNNKKKGKLIVLFGCGGNRDTLKRPLMGEVAASLSSVVIVTNDNPRDENPLLIRNSIVEGCNRVTKKKTEDVSAVKKEEEHPIISSIKYFKKENIQTDTFPIDTPQTDTFPIENIQTDTFPIENIQTDTFPIDTPQTDTFPIENIQTDTFQKKGLHKAKCQLKDYVKDPTQQTNTTQETGCHHEGQKKDDILHGNAYVKNTTSQFYHKNQKDDICDYTQIHCASCGCHIALFVIADRYAAIQKGISLLRADDILLIAGKGHEQNQLIEGVSYPFNDRLVVAEIMEMRADKGPCV
jgi:hypothetical protein